LNLTHETLEGLIKHNGPFLDLNKMPQTIKDICLMLDIDFRTHSSLEGQVANISDDIAYLTHDFDDGLREKLFSLNDLRKIDIINYILKNIENNFINIKDDILIHQLIRHLISYFINDVVSNSLAIIKKNNFKNKRFSIAIISSSYSLVINFLSTGLRYLFSFTCFDKCDALLVANAHRVDFDISVLYYHFYFIFNLTNSSYFMDTSYRISCL